MQTCYRHSGRETGVSCSSCGRPICPDCMTPTPVGMRCPECSRERTKVRTARNIQHDPTVTYVLLGINLLAFLGSISAGGGFAERGGGDAITNGALFGPAIAFDHEYWRLITSGFLHAGFLHVAFNMYLLYILGGMIEPSLGPVKFAALYFTSLLGGSFGALLFAPDALTVGASGAVFGLMGAAFVGMRARGIDVMSTGIGPLILINLGITFLFGVSGGISVGGHLGGLAMGMAAGWLLMGPVRLPRWAPLAGCLVLAIAAVAGALIVADGPGIDLFN